jgi:hypothetical protein
MPQRGNTDGEIATFSAAPNRIIRAGGAVAAVRAERALDYGVDAGTAGIKPMSWRLSTGEGGQQQPPARQVYHALTGNQFRVRRAWGRG